MLDDATKNLARSTTIAAFTTLLPDGMPMTHPLWVDADDEFLLVNTEVGRQKHRNVERDGRVAVTMWDAANPYGYVEVRGEVVEQVRGPEARAHIDQLSQRYNGVDYQGEIVTERVILKIRPTRENVRV